MKGPVKSLRSLRAVRSHDQPSRTWQVRNRPICHLSAANLGMRRRLRLNCRANTHGRDFPDCFRCSFSTPSQECTSSMNDQSSTIVTSSVEDMLLSNATSSMHVPLITDDTPRTHDMPRTEDYSSVDVSVKELENIPPRDMLKVEKAERILGYSFKNKFLLWEALAPGRKRLAVLGDSVLHSALCYQWSQTSHSGRTLLPTRLSRFQANSVGDWDKIRTAIVPNAILGLVGRNIGISDCLVQWDNTYSLKKAFQRAGVHSAVRTALDEFVDDFMHPKSDDVTFDHLAESASRKIEKIFESNFNLHAQDYIYSYIKRKHATEIEISKSSIRVADAMEACFGAVFLDSGGSLEALGDVLDRCGIGYLTTHKEVEEVEPLTTVKEFSEAKWKKRLEALNSSRPHDSGQ